MRAVKTFFLDDVVLKLTGAAGRLDCIHVQTRTNTTRFHRSGESLLIDNLAPRSDEVSTFSHRIEKFCAQQMLSFRINAVNTDDIRGARNRFRRLF